jgi:hypothetical protein
MKNRVNTGQVPAWWGKEDPKERARRLWAKTTGWVRDRSVCWRVGEDGPDEGPREATGGTAR